MKKKVIPLKRRKNRMFIEILKEPKNLENVDLNESNSSKNVYTIGQPESANNVEKGDGPNRGKFMEGLWCCTLSLACINNLCVCIRWFS